MKNNIKYNQTTSLPNIKIGAVNVKHGLFLAPMAGVTDRVFRMICREYGAGIAVSEMICARALCYEQQSRRRGKFPSAELAVPAPDEEPYAVQIFGSEPDFMAEAARMLASGEYNGFRGRLPGIIDINMGCPVKKVVSNGEGSALMRNPALAAAIVRAVVDAVGNNVYNGAANSPGIPVTVKIRSGWNGGSINAPEFARRLADAGAAAIFIHPRTRSQMFSGRADHAVTAETVRAVSVPVIANGDICKAEDALRVISETGCAGIMIGRGAMGMPWIFSEIIRASGIGGEISRGRGIIGEYYGTAQKAAAALRHAALIRELLPDVCLPIAKRHVSYYLKSVRGGSQLRDAIFRAEDFGAVCAILDGIVHDGESEL